MDHQRYGTITIWYIDKIKLGDDFYWLMDAFHSGFARSRTSIRDEELRLQRNVAAGETEHIASQVFNTKGVFKSKFLSEGTGVWGPEVDVSPLCYLESIKIDKEFRGKGIGTWALEQIWKIDENLEVSLLYVLFSISRPIRIPTLKLAFSENRKPDSKTFNS